MGIPSRHRRPRLLGALVAPGLATFTAWWLFLGLDPDDYTMPQCAALVLVLVAVGVAAGWLTRPHERGAAIVSAALGISAGCFTSWMDDETGLFIVGWVMLTPFAFLGSALVVALTASARSAWDRSHRRGPAA